MKYFLVVAAAMGLASCGATEQGDPLGEATTDGAGSMHEDVELRDGPFGYDIGQPLRSIENVDETDGDLRIIESPPKPHPDFESVALIGYSDTGICSIRGIGRNLENDGTGSQIRSKVDELAAALETKYGEPKKVDICQAGDIGCNTNYWMMFLGDGQRSYGYLWEQQNEAMQAANIGSIAVVAKAANIQTSYPVLEFYAADEASCEAAANASSAQSL